MTPHATGDDAPGQQLDGSGPIGRVRRAFVGVRALVSDLLTRAHELFWRLEDGPLRPILGHRSVMWLRTTVAATFAHMTEDEVLAVLDELERAGVRAWLVGGWGVDALLHRRSRRHSDVDLVVLASEGSAERACAALGRVGYAIVDEGDVPNAGMPHRILLDDGSGTSVDLHPIDASVPLFASATRPGELDPSAFATGTLAGRAVPCVSARCQVSLKSYPGARAKDERDIEQLKHLIPDAA